MSNKPFVFGIDIGGTTVKCGLFHKEQGLLEKWEIPTRTENGGVNIVPDVGATILAKFSEKGLTPDTVSGIGVGVPGPVGPNGDVPQAVNLNWGYVDVAGDLKAMTGVPVYAGNDANVAALGEYFDGAGKGSSSMIMVTIGTGVGGGIIINGKILTGAHGAGGEIGHIAVSSTPEKPCNCGGLGGHLEQYASATGIVYLAVRRLEKDEASSVLRGLESITAKAVLDAYKDGDPLAVEIMEEFGAYMGRGLATCAAVIDPELFVVGGGVSKAGDVLIDLIMKNYKKNAFPACQDIKMEIAILGNDAGIYGAARLAW